MQNIYTYYKNIKKHVSKSMEQLDFFLWILLYWLHVVSVRNQSKSHS